MDSDWTFAAGRRDIIYRAFPWCARKSLCFMFETSEHGRSRCSFKIRLQYPLCSYVTRDAISCCSPVDGEAADRNIRWLAEDEHDSFCEAPLEDTDYAAGCDPHKWETVHNAEDALFIITMMILSIFFVEISLLMVALTPSVFFRQFWYVLDLFIVSVSIALEVWFHVASNESAAALSGMVVIGRCWRFVRVGHGLMSATAEMTSMKYEEVVKLAEELENLLEKYDEQLGEPNECSETDMKEFREKKKAVLDKLHKLDHQPHEE